MIVCTFDSSAGMDGKEPIMAGGRSNGLQAKDYNRGGEVCIDSEEQIIRDYKRI